MSAYSYLRAIYRRLGSPGNRTIFSGQTEVSRLFLRVKAMLEKRAAYDEIYDREYYEKYSDVVAVSAVHIVDFILAKETPKSCADVGCGSGEILLEFSKHGVDCFGFDNSSASLNICRERGLQVEKLDLADPPSQVKKVDLVISTEVAEHLPIEAADGYVSFLINCADVIYMTAATPGQGGTMHLNEQPYSYWIEKFEVAGMVHDAAGTRAASQEWLSKGVEEMRSLNLLIFRRA